MHGGVVKKFRIGPWLISVLLAAGCAGPGPRLFPAAPIELAHLGGGAIERRYDEDRDGRIDYAEVLSSDGVLSALRFDSDGDGTFDDQVELARIDPSERRDLILLLDSIPFHVVREAWDSGRLRMFHPPVRVVTPFPGMTDVSFSEFFGVTPVPGVESQYYDGQKLRSGLSTYLGEGNAPWLRYVDYRLRPLAHACAYLDSHPWFLHELGRIERRFLSSAAGPLTRRTGRSPAFASRTVARSATRRVKGGTFVGYCVGTSALGAQYGRDGHWAGLVLLDRFCQAITHRTRGRTRITLLSDHGHNLLRSRPVRLTETLTQLGYRVASRLERPGDVVVPRFGVVSCAAIHTRQAARVARDVVGIEGVDLAAYLDDRGDVIVLNRDGLARISAIGSTPAGADGRDARLGDARRGYRYVAERGDPLKLIPVFDGLTKQGVVDDDGFVDDAALFEATVDQDYPDAAHRLWRAFHGLIAHPPEVLVSLCDGWHTGSATFATLRPMYATHGNLRPPSTNAFALTTADALPDVLRMEQLRAALEGAGVRLPGPDGATLEPQWTHRAHRAK